MTTQRIKKTFFELVRIDSPSGEETKVAQYIVKYLKQFKIKSTKDSNGNIIVKVPGQGRPLMLAAHMDTVNPGKGILPVIKNDVIRSKGDTVLGADDKAGITIILEALRYLKEKNIKHSPLELVFTREEETGLIGASKLNYKKLSAKEALVLDSDGAPGGITIAAPFLYLMDIEVTGKAAHAGAAPEKGISAIQIAGKAIAELKLGRINKSTSNNIGIIDGGNARNVVPDIVKIKAEARSHKLETAQKQVDLFNKVFKKYVRAYKGKLKFKASLEVLGYKYSRTDEFIKSIVITNKKLNIRTRFEVSGGVSEASIYTGKGIKAIDISAGYLNMHSTKESIKLAHMLKLVNFLVDFVRI